MTTLYKKVGRRYKPVAEHEEWDSYPAGAHLVICQPGSTMRRFGIEPDRAGLLAAAEPLRRDVSSEAVEVLSSNFFTTRVGRVALSPFAERLEGGAGGAGGADGCAGAGATNCSSYCDRGHASGDEPHS